MPALCDESRWVRNEFREWGRRMWQPSIDEENRPPSWPTHFIVFYLLVKVMSLWLVSEGVAMKEEWGAGILRGYWGRKVLYYCLLYDDSTYVIFRCISLLYRLFLCIKRVLGGMVVVMTKFPCRGSSREGVTIAVLATILRSWSFHRTSLFFSFPFPIPLENGIQYTLPLPCLPSCRLAAVPWQWVCAARVQLM